MILAKLGVLNTMEVTKTQECSQNKAQLHNGLSPQAAGKTGLPTL